jgi:hypothetical protein
MTMNYPVGDVEVTRLRPRWKKRPQEDIDREIAERGLKPEDVGLKVDFMEPDTVPIRTGISWVSHGNYALCQEKFNAPEGDIYPHVYIEIETEYFDQIIEAFESKEIPSDRFEPFWKARMPLRGMVPFSRELRVYFFGNKRGLAIHEITLNPFGGIPSDDIDEMVFTLEDFKKVRDMALSAKEKPIHYTTIDWGKAE